VLLAAEISSIYWLYSSDDDVIHADIFTYNYETTHFNMVVFQVVLKVSPECMSYVIALPTLFVKSVLSTESSIDAKTNVSLSG
jgi:hypothetical protein